MSTRREFIALAGASVAAWPLGAMAQQGDKVPRIVLLSNGLPDDRRQAIFQGLADYGYVDGKNVSVEILTAPTIADVPVFAARAVASKPDVIVTVSSAPPLAVKALTSTIPVVFAGLQDPVAVGLVASYAHPGGNLTGVMQGGPEYAGKEIELIREVMPKIARLGLIGLPADPIYQASLAQVLVATKALGIETILLETKEGDDFTLLFERALKGGAQAVYVISATPLTTLPNSALLADMALRYKLPAFSGSVGPAQNGMLLGYGANINDVARRSGGYVDAILKGAKPADLPIQLPRVFELVINLKTAKALGISIPPTLLARADEVIE